MATTTEISGRIERRLRALLAEVEDLPNVSAEWDQWSEGNQVSYSLDWDHLMADYLTELDGYYRAGDMTPDQQARYYELLRKLEANLPIIRCLNLFPPPIPLDT